MIFPDYLKAHEQGLQKYKLDYVKIVATPLEKGQELGLIESKFLGKPYLPIAFDYPIDKNGKQMILFAQINFSEVPKLEHYPEKGILQLFVSGDSWQKMEDYQIIFHENIEEEKQTDFSFLTEDLYATSPIHCEHSLAFSKETEYGGSEDFRFDYSFNGEDYWEFEENLNEEQQKEIEKFFYNLGHKIGGYAFFTQSDPRYYDERAKRDVLLLQIDSDDKIMFGDNGVSHLFININDLKNKKFEKAYFYWDCC